MNVYTIEYSVDLGVSIVAILSTEEKANELCAELENKRIAKIRSTVATNTIPDWLYFPQYNVVQYTVDDISYIEYLFQNNRA